MAMYDHGGGCACGLQRVCTCSSHSQSDGSTPTDDEVLAYLTERGKRHCNVDKGGHNDWPSQVMERPSSPPPSNPRVGSGANGMQEGDRIRCQATGIVGIASDFTQDGDVTITRDNGNVHRTKWTYCEPRPLVAVPAGRQFIRPQDVTQARTEAALPHPFDIPHSTPGLNFALPICVGAVTGGSIPAFKPDLKTLQGRIDYMRGRDTVLERVGGALDLVRTEVSKAMTKWPPITDSPHHHWGVMAEEFKEVTDEVFTDNIRKAREEAIQLAAMAIRFLVEADLPLWARKPPEAPKPAGPTNRYTLMCGACRRRGVTKCLDSDCSLSKDFRP